MPEIHLTPLAKEDLIDIWVFIALENNSPMNADRFINKLENAFFKLAQNPKIGRNRSSRTPGIRSWPLGNYLIFYKPNPDVINVVRVINAKQNLDHIFR
jgi:toxin ParE1/3/4